MAKKRSRIQRSRVGAAGDSTMLYVGLGVAAVAVLYFMSQKSTTPTTVIKTVPAPTGSSTTAAEIAAGTALVTTALNDFGDDDND